jgi:hypothetical protein
MVVVLYPKSAKNCGALGCPSLPIEAPNAVLDADETFATRRIHESAELIDCTIIPRRELEHRLDAIQREPAEIREHALNELTVHQLQRAQCSTRMTTHLPENLHLLSLLLLYCEHNSFFLRENRARPGRRHSHMRGASILGYALE